MSDLLKFGIIGVTAWILYKQLQASKGASAGPIISPVKPKPTIPIGIKPAISTTSSNTGMAAIQARLNALGAKPSLVVDGVSGPKTLAAIKTFQSSHGIEADGIVGPITQAALGIGPAVAQAATQPTVEIIPPEEPMTYTPTVLSHL